MNNLTQQAINSALKGDWEKAIEANKKLIDSEPDDVDALNRLARAYAEMGNFAKARHFAQKAIEVDPFNSIAKKSLAKWKGLKKSAQAVSRPVASQVFLEEPGKTKIVSLINLGSTSIIATLDSGCEVKLTTHGHRICVQTIDGSYIGKLSDNISTHLKSLISKGYEYEVYIKSADIKDIKIFIKEVNRKDHLSGPSFSSEIGDTAYL